MSLIGVVDGVLLFVLVLHPPGLPYLLFRLLIKNKVAAHPLLLS